ncbi:MAG TPA: PKD domain-containing protein [Acidimicrobiia bacterium]|nr:PKD domain-containing protein [Acidimicrobiia bacterium]
MINLRFSAFARRTTPRRLVVLAVLVVFTASSGVAYAASSPVDHTVANRASTVDQLTYHGGPVLHSSAVSAMFWVPNGYTFPHGYAQTVRQYFTDVAHDSFLPTNVFSVDTQYYNVANGVKRFASYSVVDRGSTVDPHAYPKSGCPNYVLDSKAGSKSTACLTDSQVQHEIRSVIAAHHLPTGTGNEYFLFTPPGVATCKSPDVTAPRDCFDPMQRDGYCAYHSHLSGTAVLFVVLPYEAPTGVCWSGQSPNGGAADSVVNTASHEQNESITDPFGTGWFDGAGNEVGDKCHLIFGPAISSTSTGQYNERINGHGYWLQELWSDRARACVQRNTYPRPAVTFAFAPASPVHGKKVQFASSVSEPGATTFTYRWTFPDGAGASVRNPVHEFPKPVFVGIVTLVVSDGHGDQTRVLKAITVA